VLAVALAVLDVSCGRPAEVADRLGAFPSPRAKYLCFGLSLPIVATPSLLRLLQRGVPPWGTAPFEPLVWPFLIFNQLLFTPVTCTEVGPRTPHEQIHAASAPHACGRRVGWTGQVPLPLHRLLRFQPAQGPAAHGRPHASSLKPPSCPV
jgi:hypothetical protein